MFANAAIKAGLTLALLSTAAPAFAQVDVQGDAAPVATTNAAVVQTAPATLMEGTTVIPGAPRLMQAAPACMTRTMTMGATIPTIPVIPVTVPMRCGAADYLPPNVDYSQDFIWEPFGPETDFDSAVGSGAAG